MSVRDRTEAVTPDILRTVRKVSLDGERCSDAETSDEANVIEMRRSILDLGFVGYLKEVEKFHEQLDVEARARRQIQEELRNVLECQRSTIDRIAENTICEERDELHELRCRKQDTEDEVDERVAEVIGDHEATIVSQLVHTICKNLSMTLKLNTAAAITIASAQCKALEGTLFALSTLSGVREDHITCVRIAWLCRVACYIPREGSYLDNLVAELGSAVDQREAHETLMDRTIPFNPLTDDISEVLLRYAKDQEGENP